MDQEKISNERISISALKTFLYEQDDLNEIEDLIKRYFSLKYPRVDLNKYPANYENLAYDINDKLKEKIIKPRFICDLYNNERSGSKKNVKKFEATRDYLYNFFGIKKIVKAENNTIHVSPQTESTPEGINSLQEMIFRLTKSQNDLFEKINSNYFQINDTLGYSELDKKIKRARKKNDLKTLESLFSKKLEKSIADFTKAKKSIINHAVYFISTTGISEKFEEGIKYADIIIDNGIKDNGILKYSYFRKAYFLVKLGKKEDALDCIKNTLSMNPELNISSLRFIAAIHYYFDELTKTKIILDDIIISLLSRPDTADSHLINLPEEVTNFKEKPFNLALLPLYKNKYQVCIEMGLIEEAEKAKANFNALFGADENFIFTDFRDIKEWLEMDNPTKGIMNVINKEIMLNEVVSIISLKYDD